MFTDIFYTLIYYPKSCNILLKMNTNVSMLNSCKTHTPVLIPAKLLLFIYAIVADFLLNFFTNITN